MKKIIIFVFSVSLIASCKKDKDTCNQDMAGMSATYRITAAPYKASPTAAEQDYYNQLFTDPCERDDLLILNSNGTYTYTDAGVKCVPPGDDTGTWSVNGNIFTIDGEANTIQSFDCSSLVFTEVDIFVSGDQLKLTLTRQ